MLNGTDYCWAEHTRNWYKRFCIRIRFSDVNATKSNPKFEMSSKLLFRIASNHLISCLFWLSLPFSLSLRLPVSLYIFPELFALSILHFGFHLQAVCVKAMNHTYKATREENERERGHSFTYVTFCYISFDLLGSSCFCTLSILADLHHFGPFCIFIASYHIHTQTVQCSLSPLTRL